MTHGGEPRSPAGLGLWLVVSLLAHGLALPLLRDGSPPQGRSGEDLHVRLVAAAQPARAGTAAGAGGVGAEPAPDRRRDTLRLREPRADPSSTPHRADTAMAVPITHPPITNAAEPDDSAADAATAALSATSEGITTTQPNHQATPRPEPDGPMIATGHTAAETTPAQDTHGGKAATGADRAPAQAPIETPVGRQPEQAARVTEAPLPGPVQAAPVAGKGAETAAPPAPQRVEAVANAASGAPPAEDSHTAAASASATVSPAGTTDAMNTSFDSGADSALLALLHRAIDNQKRYPTLARRQRREGTATVLFRLHPDGALEGLQLGGSSGFDLLDRAALRAVAGVAPFTPATRYLKREKQFRVEVEFRLF